ncbi:hypothetical protein MTO96_044340, partial [Rhipicephalus appendiculatus]
FSLSTTLEFGKRANGRREFKVDDVLRMMKLNVRVSKTFQEISTDFDKTQGLLSWKNPETTLCLLLALLALVVLAFWKGQAFAVQVIVTLIHAEALRDRLPVPPVTRGGQVRPDQPYLGPACP